MALCDQLEQQSYQQLDAHNQLVDALLATLTQNQNADELANNWQRLAAHFDTLFTTGYSINSLKQTILQLAVMGKLCKQDPNDEPASELYAEITKVRERLASNEGLKTSANEQIDDDELYLSCPEGWKWLRLGNLAKFIDYRGKTPIKTDNGVRLITAKNIKYGYIDLNPEEYISHDDYKSWMTRGFPEVGDVLFTTEAPLGNVAKIELVEPFALAQRAICFQWHTKAISQFMLFQLIGAPFQQQLILQATGMTATGIKASRLKEIPVLLPPLNEQVKISNKVIQLFELCDVLAKNVSNTKQTQSVLAESLVGQVVA